MIDRILKAKKQLYIALGALALFIIIVGSFFQFFQFSTYYVVFQDVSLLEVGADVIVDELKVGEVKNIDFLDDNSGELLVELKIDNEINLPDHSIASMVRKNKPENVIIMIELISSDNYYKPGDTIIAQYFSLNIDSLVGLSNSVKDMVIENQLKSVNDNVVVYSVQLLASKYEISLEPQNFNGLKEIRLIREGGICKYVYGEKSTLEDANGLKMQLQNMGYKDAFIVAFKNGKRIPLSDI